MDFEAVFVMGLPNARFSRSVCEAALAHVVSDRTEAAYFRSDLFEQRTQLMDAWTKFVTVDYGRAALMQA